MVINHFKILVLSSALLFILLCASGCSLQKSNYPETINAYYTAWDNSDYSEISSLLADSFDLSVLISAFRVSDFHFDNPSLLRKSDKSG